ncbi:hypothetical protein ACQKMD_20255 [Viridibacillus sp. NPDC096237]|uniref:hypothetical protein n=1 Tax=Viridibacillus sp. NPDC096237 TaxID=3390721 RepID=UPI003D0811CA
MNIEIAYFKNKRLITDDFPISLNEINENIYMINFSMLQIPNLEKERLVKFLFSLTNVPFYMYIELDNSDEKEFENQLIKNNNIFVKKITTKSKTYFEVTIQKLIDFEKIMDDFIYQICLGNQVLFSTNNSNLQFNKKIDVIGFSKVEIIHVDITIRENTSVIFIGNDANEMFLLSKNKQYANIDNLKNLLPDFVQFTHQDVD